MHELWISGTQLITPRGLVEGSVRIANGRIAAVRRRVPRGARAVNLRGAYLAPGFIDLHVWGEPQIVARDADRFGTTAFLTTLGPEIQTRLVEAVRTCASVRIEQGARCLGVHLEGPFLNPARSGALAKAHLRTPTVRELKALVRQAAGRLRLITIAPELPGALNAIRWCHQRRIVVSLGHSEADAKTACRAIRAGAKAATHIFNAMRPWHHRAPALLDVALTDQRLVAMVIADGIHVSPTALRVLFRTKGPSGVALVTDSVRHQRRTWTLRKRAGAYYTPRGVLAGSALTMIDAVRNAVTLGGVSLTDAVRMATETPARLLGDETRGRLQVGRRADLVVFDEHFRVRLTIVGGRIIYQQRP